MNVYILNNNFERVGVIDNFESFIWTDRWSECGDFELVVTANSPYTDYLIVDNYIQIKESEHLMIIESVTFKNSFTDGDSIIVSGRSIESILDRRILCETIKMETEQPLQRMVQSLINKNIISPTNNKRTINNFIMEYNSDIPDTETILAQFDEGTSIYDAITSICSNYDLGFKITLNSNNEFVFKMFPGVDRSYLRVDINDSPLVIFSPDFENLNNSEFLQSNKVYKNDAFLRGENILYVNPKVSNQYFQDNSLLVEKNPELSESDKLLTVKYKNLNITQGSNLLRKIMGAYNQSDAISINNKTYYNYRVMESFDVTPPNGTIKVKKLDNTYIKIGNAQYGLISSNIGNDKISVTIEFTNIYALYLNILNNIASNNGALVIENKVYSGFNTLSSINIFRDRTITIEFNKTIVPNEPSVNINNKEYHYERSSLSVSDNNLSFKLIHLGNYGSQDVNTIYSDLQSMNGGYVFDEIAYLNYKKISSINLTGTESASISLGKEDTTEHDSIAVINNVSYTVSSWSINENVLSLTFKNVQGNISDFINTVKNGAKTNPVITIDGTSYNNYVNAENANVSWSDDGVSVSMQFKKYIDKYVTLNNVNYALESYDVDDEELSITFRNILNPMELFNNAKIHAANNNIVVDGNTYTIYKDAVRCVVSLDERLSPTEVKSYVNIVFSKPTMFTFRLNGHEYTSYNVNETDKNLTIDVYEVTNNDIEQLVYDAKNHNGNITINGITYTGYTKFTSANITAHSVNTGYTEKRFDASLSFNKPEEEETTQSKSLNIYSPELTQEPNGLFRRELYVNASDISSENEDGIIITDTEYYKLLRNKGEVELASNDNSFIESLDANYEFNAQFVYGRDFYIGDLVSVEDKFGHSANARVYEYIYSQDASGINNYPTFIIYNE